MPCARAGQNRAGGCDRRPMQLTCLAIIRDMPLQRSISQADHCGRTENHSLQADVKNSYKAWKLIWDSEMIRSTKLFRAVASGSLFALVAGCGSDDIPAPSATEAGAESSYNTTGNFSCHAGKPSHEAQITQSVNVAPGATAQITVQGPPGLPESLNPARIYAYCTVDGHACVGTSCAGKPPVDFIGKNGKGPTWESIRSIDGNNQISFTAMAHNGDSEAHDVTLMIDVPVN